jgi:hypothetical protein
VGANFLLAPPYGACTTRANGGVYGTIWVVIGAYIPLAAMGFVYVMLFSRLALTQCSNSSVAIGSVRELQKNGPHQSSGSNGPSERTLKRKISSAKMLVASYVWYCICFLPGPLILTEFPHLFARYPMLSHWMLRSLLLCGYAVSPVSLICEMTDNGLCPIGSNE